MTMPEPTRRDPWVRAAALQAACRWRPWTPGQPEADAIDALFVLADRFAGWIEGDE